MSGWQVGDLAVCVFDGAAPHRNSPSVRSMPPVKQSSVYTVTSILLDDFGKPTLVLDGSRPGLRVNGREYGWWADRFRKVVRDKHEACEAEFVTLLKRSTRKVSA